MATSLRELIVSVSADTTKYQREMDRASRMGGQYFRSIQQGGADATRTWDRQTSAARTHATALDASTQAISRYAAVAAGAFSVGTLISMADDWGQISARIRIATNSQEDFALAQTRLMEIANRTYRDYTEAADQFAGTAQSMREMGFSAADTLNAAEALGLALVAGGSNAQRGAAANDAWAKSMVQGRIATDQFQTLLLQTPRVIQALGEGLGKTTQELQQMAKDGQLTANVVVPAITAQMGKLRGEVEAMPTTVQDAGIRFRNELRAWVGGQNEATGASQVLVRGIEAVTENMEALIAVGGAAALGALAGKVLQIGAATAQAAISAVQSRGALIAEAVAVRDATLMAQQKAQADLRRAQAAMTAARGTAESARQSRNLASALLIERQATVAAEQAKLTYARASNIAAAAGRGMLGLLGGPAGLALTVGAVAAGWLLFRDNSTEATKALRDMTGPLDAVLAKFTELGAAQQMQAMRDAEQALSDSVGRMRDSVADLQSGISDQFLRPVFDQIDQDVRAGTITVEEGSKRMTEALQRFFRTSYTSEGLRNSLIDSAAAWEESARSSQGASDRVEAFRKTQEQAKPALDATTGAVGGQATAFDLLGDSAGEAGKRIRSALDGLPGQIERVGKSAAQVARLDVRDWFREEAGKGLNFENREDPNVRKAIETGERYIRLQTGLASAQDAHAKSTKAATAATKASTDAQKEAERRVEQAGQYLADLNQSYGDLALSLQREIDLHGQVGRAAQLSYDLANGGLNSLQEPQKQHLRDLTQQLELLEANTRAAAGYQTLMQKYATPAEGRRREVSDDRSAAYMALLNGDLDTEGYDNLMGRIDAKAKETMGGMSSYADQAARNMQSALGDSLYSILDGKFTDIGDSFSNMLKRMVAEMAASRIWEMAGNAMAGYTGQGGWANAIRSIGGAMQTQGKRAGGGQVQPFSAYDVTEQGPELLQYGGRQVLMMGSAGGVVSPLMNKAGGGAASGSGELRVTINNNGDNKVSARQEVQQGGDGRMLRNLIIDVVAESLNGGALGSLGKGRYGWREAI